MSLGVKEMITPILNSCVPLGRIAMVCDILLLNQQVKG
jgi:hypothetical protein